MARGRSGLQVALVGSGLWRVVCSGGRGFSCLLVFAAFDFVALKLFGVFGLVCVYHLLLVSRVAVSARFCLHGSRVTSSSIFAVSSGF